MKSQKLSDSEKERLYFEFIDQNKINSEKIKKIEEDIKTLIKDAFYKKYLKAKKDREFFENNKEILINKVAFDISLEGDYRELISKEDLEIYPQHFFSMKIIFPKIRNKLSLKSLLKEEKIEDLIQKMLLEKAKLELEDIKVVNKYIPHDKIKNFYYYKNNFCKGITTTSQLKSKFPEIYKIYEEFHKSEDIKELRKDLGYF